MSFLALNPAFASKIGGSSAQHIFLLFVVAIFLIGQSIHHLDIVLNFFLELVVTKITRNVLTAK